ncbi:MAG: RNA methyltransferase [Halobacteriovoraceae bacterium]|nr:RNA methyltransferase [Halobacteriovoraceae bacterium]
MKYYKNNSPTDELIEKFSSLKKLDNYQKIIVDGPKCFMQLLKTDLKIHEILTQEKYLNLLDHRRMTDTHIHILENYDLEKIIGHKVHQGIIAIADAPPLLDINFLSGPAICLNGLTSPENVGSIIRTAAAFNIKNIIFDQKTVNPFSRRCIRVSMGNIFNINVSYSQNLIQDLQKLRNTYQIISTANKENSKEISATKFDSNSLIIIGSEGHGIDKQILEISDIVSKIPISHSTLHLNASISAAIYMYELTRNTNV